MPPARSERSLSSSCPYFLTLRRQTDRSDRMREHRFPKSITATIRSSAQNAVAGEAHPAENERPGKARNGRRFRRHHGQKRQNNPESANNRNQTSSRSSLANSALSE